MRKTGNLNIQCIYFPEIFGTQRKSIIEVKQVLSKYFAEFSVPLCAKGENPHLWTVAKMVVMKAVQRRRDEERGSAWDIFTPRKRSNFLILARIAQVFRTSL